MNRVFCFFIFCAFAVISVSAADAPAPPKVECVWSDQSWATFRVTNNTAVDLFMPTMFFYETVIPAPAPLSPADERWGASSPAFWTRMTDNISDLVPLPRGSSVAFTVRRQPQKMRIRLYFSPRATRDEKDLTTFLSDSLPELPQPK